MTRSGLTFSGGIAMASTVWLFVQPVSALAGMSATPGQICDALAASAFDRTKPPSIPPVAYNVLKTNAAAAVSACDQAAQGEPGQPRYLFELGRALEAAGREADAEPMYVKASMAGYGPASRSLGLIFYDGSGVGKDLTIAFGYYRTAVEQGDTDAMLNLGAMYEGGEGVAVDMATARSLYLLAKSNGDSDADKYLSELDASSLAPDSDQGELVDFFKH